jgi:hypothetical protein
MIFFRAPLPEFPSSIVPSINRPNISTTKRSKLKFLFIFCPIEENLEFTEATILVMDCGILMEKSFFLLKAGLGNLSSKTGLWTGCLS